MNELISFIISLILVLVVIVLGLLRHKKEKRRLETLAGALGASVVHDKITGQFNTVPFELRTVYAGKGRRLFEAVLCMPFEGCPFSIRKENDADRIVARLSRHFQDFQTGDAEFDKRFHASVAGAHRDWMREYTDRKDRREAMEWFFENGYASLHSDGGRVYATYRPVQVPSGYFGLVAEETWPVWNPDFIRRSLEALERAAKLDRPVAYQSWEEWRKNIASGGLKIDGPQGILLAAIVAMLAWMGIAFYMSSRG